MPETITIKFVDFWFDDFELKWLEPFNTILNELYDVKVVDNNPDFLLFSSFGNEHFNHFSPTKIFYTAEVGAGLKDRERFADADYSFSFYDRQGDPNHFRLPSWARWRYHRLHELTKSRKPGKILNNKSKFCNFLYSNSHPPERKKFFDKLSQYKQVDSGGSVLNNIGREIEQGKCIDWTENYKFNIAFENQRHEGYVTEKIMRSFLAKSIPIYWGSDFVERDFNPNSFIHVENMNDISYYINRIKEIDQDDDKYKTIMAESPFKNNKIPKQWRKDTLREKFKEVFDGNK